MTDHLAMWPPLNITLPDGLTWDGETGREWEVTGTGLTMDYPPSPRVTLATALLSAVGDGVQVYNSPPDVLVPPAIVIRPADPYQAPATASGGMSAAWAFDVDIVMGRNKSELSLAGLERAREVLTAALPDGWRWVEFGEIGEVEIGKKTYLKATLGVAVIATEGMASNG